MGAVYGIATKFEIGPGFLLSPQTSLNDLTRMDSDRSSATFPSSSIRYSAKGLTVASEFWVTTAGGLLFNQPMVRVMGEQFGLIISLAHSRNLGQ